MSTAEEEGLLRAGSTSDSDFDPTCYTESDDERRHEELRKKKEKGSANRGMVDGSGGSAVEVSSDSGLKAEDLAVTPKRRRK